MEDSPIQSMAELTSDLVKIPSVSGNAEAVAEAASLVSDWLSEHGARPRIREFEKGAPVVIAEAGKGKRSIMINGHMDVVPEGERKGWAGDPYSGRISGRTIFGRGSVDMKGGLSVLMHVFSELVDSVDYRLVFAAVPDEETGGSTGSRHLAEAYSPDMVLIGEPGRSALIGIGEKGRLCMKMVGRGKAAHASLPSLGDNAIMRVTRDLGRLSAISGKKLKVPEEIKGVLAGSQKELGKDIGIISFNPGVIRGGLAQNVVPDYCEADIDMRIPPGTTTDEGFAMAKSLVKETELAVSLSSEPSYTRESVPCASRFIKVAKRHCKGAKLFIKNGGTDGRYFRYKGVPTISFGPGANRLTHAYNERIAFDELGTAYAVYREFLLSAGR